MDLVSKLQLKQNSLVALLEPPEGADAALDGLNTTSYTADADALIVFVVDREALERCRGEIIGAVGRDALVWVAYPKAGQLGTDLNRDLLAVALAGQGVRPVRQIAVDELWSALRFRPA